MSNFMSMNDSLLQPRVISSVSNTMTSGGGGGGGGGGGTSLAVRKNGGGGGANPNDARLIKGYQQAAAQANAQEVARFNKMMGLAQQFGAGLKKQNQQLYGQEVAQGNSNLVDRGLFNSSAAAANTTNANNNLSFRNAQVADQQTQMQLGVLGQVQVQRPDSGLMAQLFSQPRDPNAPYIPPMNGPDLFGLGGGSTTVKRKK